MPDYDRSGCAVVVESVLRILHTDERQATYTYDSPLTHPYLSCEYFTEFHAVSRLAFFLRKGAPGHRLSLLAECMILSMTDVIRRLVKRAEIAILPLQLKNLAKR